jgi:hypothetical protein
MGKLSPEAATLVDVYVNVNGLSIARPGLLTGAVPVRAIRTQKAQKGRRTRRRTSELLLLIPSASSAFKIAFAPPVLQAGKIAE